MTNCTHSTDDPDVDNLSVQTLTDHDVARVVLHGEADLATLPELDGALSVAEAGALDGANCVTLDVTELGFADVATIRRLAVFAKRAKQTGHDVTTCGATPTIRKVATIMGVDGDLGLT